MMLATVIDAHRKAYRAKIKSLFDKSRGERLADVWQRVYPLPIDPTCELPDRRGIIEDLADFADVLQPSLNGLSAHRLCRLIEKYATCGSRQSDLTVSHTASPHGGGELLLGIEPHQRSSLQSERPIASQSGPTGRLHSDRGSGLGDWLRP